MKKTRKKIRQSATRLPRGSGPWRHIGGGTFVAASGDQAKYPCDDAYQHDKTKKIVTAITTIEQHFKMPLRAQSIAELRKLSGVKSVQAFPR